MSDKKDKEKSKDKDKNKPTSPPKLATSPPSKIASPPSKIASPSSKVANDGKTKHVSAYVPNHKKVFSHLYLIFRIVIKLSTIR